MDFDPLDLFSPTQSSFTQHPVLSDESHTNDTYVVNDMQCSTNQDALNKSTVSDNIADEEDTVISPIHIHDLPLLQNSPPYQILIAFLHILSPEISLNFAPRSQLKNEDSKISDPSAVLLEKKVNIELVPWDWLEIFCSRFNTPAKLASLSVLADSFKTTFASQYNGWLTQLISSQFGWLTECEASKIQSLAALRLAENCGRTAQPEMLRSIDIPMLSNKIILKEPSLTSDNLGLKTWGSSFILGCRLASHPNKYLVDPVLELGAGTGLVGMVSCCLGYPAMLTDLGEIVPNLLSNIEQNDIENAEVAELDWSKPQGFLEKYGIKKYSTIILSDPVYSSQHPPWIVDMINLFLDPSEESRVLIQVPVRRSFEKERSLLWQLMDANGFDVEEECEELGFDDFGESSFIFKKFVRFQKVSALS